MRESISKILLLIFISINIFSCSHQNKTALDLYRDIKDRETILKLFHGYLISNRGTYHIISIKNEKGCLVYNFKKNKEHFLELNENTGVISENRKKIYLLLDFMCDHQIIEVDGNLQLATSPSQIEFRTTSDEILIYFNGMNMYQTEYKINEKTFKKINSNWGYYLGKPKS